MKRDRTSSATPDGFTIPPEKGSLKQLAGDLEKMLMAQRERLERFYLSPRTWNYPTWRDRYLDHPLLANQCRRLIWQFTDGKRSASAREGDTVFLPFEGDGILSIILSRAFLLADDARIKDETILRQIRSY